MGFVGTVVALIAAGLAMLLAVVLIRFNLKRRRIARAARRISEPDLRRLYALVEACGDEPHNGFLLAKTSRQRENGGNVVGIPSDIDDFPWAGRAIGVQAGDQVAFTVGDGPADETWLGGRQFLPVRVPRKKTKSGKLRNDFTPRVYISRNAALKRALEGLSPEKPEELLNYLLCSGRESFEFDAMDQARIGTSPTWVQNAKYRKCPECRKSMALILQLPGSMLGKPYGSATFYLFGCPDHPDRTAPVTQFC